MKECKKCGNEFEPCKGLKNYCSMYCRTSRGPRSEEVKKKISRSALTSTKVKEANILNGKSRLGIPIGVGYEYSPRVQWQCPVCDTILRLTEFKASKRKFCSGACRNKINNKLICGTRSKAEKILEHKIKTQLSSLSVITNDRSILDGLELDFYFPDLKLAIEWNGIYHYKDVHDNPKSFQHKLNTDKLKLKLTEELGIKLLVVKDLTSSNKFINTETDKIIQLLQTLV